jgi:hypothetical protein
MLLMCVILTRLAEGKSTLFYMGLDMLLLFNFAILMLSLKYDD